MEKEKIICDTDTMIDFWDTSSNRHTKTKFAIENLIELDNVILSAVTKMELMIGAISRIDMTKISKNLGRFNIALINGDITIQSFNLIEKYRLSHGLLLADSIIAATAIVSDFPLYTYNIKDFKFIEGLKLFEP